MSRRNFLILYKFSFALLVIAAIATQLSHGVKLTLGFSIVNFLSFFTIESNLFGVLIMGMSAYYLYTLKKRDDGLDVLRGAATLYMVTTGIIYAILLSGTDVQTPLPWVNAVLHYIFPLAVLIDWLIDKPAAKTTLKQSLLWLIFPLVYAAYALIRGPFANHWYPYPFLNPAQHGYATIALNCVVIGVAVAVLSLIIARLPRLGRKLAK
jgi:hypothetical protein